MVIDSESFRAVMAQWASGVTVVTTVHEGQNVGITASSFSSVSLEPPRVLICVAKRLFTHKVIEATGVFAVNILGADQQELGMRFAGRVPEGQDRFAGLEVFTGKTGAPLLTGVLGWLDCRLHAAFDGGDHTIFVGDVVAASAVEAGDPILYYNRQWRQLDPLR
jgi:flavin reductase (DIM6/NTAB) family NADH-FMN oxidoreductase RutF